MQDPERFQRALQAFEQVHQADENRVSRAGRETTKASLYHERLAFWVESMSERPSESLLLAARCQHLRRDAIPRRDYPEGRTGYRRWRTALARLHAREAGEILDACGYSEEVVQRVQELLLKKRLKIDPEVQLFEDAICLVFLEMELSSFAVRHEEEKVLRVLARTWRKMSPRGQKQGMELMTEQPLEIRELVERALG